MVILSPILSNHKPIEVQPIYFQKIKKKFFSKKSTDLKKHFGFSWKNYIFKFPYLILAYENVIKISRKTVFWDRSIFFENIFYFLKGNRLNFNRLVARNSRTQYHHFDTRKTEKSLPKQPLPRLWERANHGQNPQMDVAYLQMVVTPSSGGVVQPKYRVFGNIVGQLFRTFGAL